MTPDAVDIRLIAALADGLPLSPHPYADLGAGVGLPESEVIDRLQRLIEGRVIRRFGVIVRHHELGYRANAMSVWDVPDDSADRLGVRMAAYPFVTLCYRRPRFRPVWPYNLFCMVHGKDRAVVEAQIGEVIDDLGLGGYPHAVLFSRRRFKQRGANYGVGRPVAAAGGG